MQIVKLQGGLGNQMFQYAFGQSLQGDVAYDLSWFEGEAIQGGASKRLMELDAFLFKLNTANPEEIRLAQGSIIRKKSPLPSFLRKLLFLPKWDQYAHVFYEAQACIMEPSFLVPREHAYYVGYFNSEEYFLPIREKLLAEFQLRTPWDAGNKEILSQIELTNAVSLHVRRGDYLQASKIYALCDLEYYEVAVKKIAGLVSNPHFFLFSDDIPWVLENLKLEFPYTIVDVNDVTTGFNDLMLMSRCKHHIIANSTFSWWGAWLDINPDKVVIAPRQWFSTPKKSDLNLIPSEWIRL